MELFVPEGGLHKSGWDMSFMHIVVREIEEKEWCY